jgi:hypothetical protein
MSLDFVGWVLFIESAFIPTRLSPYVFSILSPSIINHAINSDFQSFRKDHSQESSQVNDDILSLVGSFISQSLAQKTDRYKACGCLNCTARADQIRHWFAPQSVSWLPAEDRPTDPSPKPAAMAAHPVWICLSCLRKVHASIVHCPYCGTERHLAR